MAARDRCIGKSSQLNREDALAFYKRFYAPRMPRW